MPRVEHSGTRGFGQEEPAAPPLNVQVVAGHDGRAFFLWPAKKLLAEGGLHLLSGNESEESDEGGVPVAHGCDINRTEGHSSSFAHWARE